LPLSAVGLVALSRTRRTYLSSSLYKG
jgi:hypothetical protein